MLFPESIAVKADPVYMTRQAGGGLRVSNAINGDAGNAQDTSGGEPLLRINITDQYFQFSTTRFIRQTGYLGWPRQHPQRRQSYSRDATKRVSDPDRQSLSQNRGISHQNILYSATVLFPVPEQILV